MLRLTLAISAFAMMLSASASQPLRRQKTMATDDGKEVIVVRRGGPDLSWWEATDGQCYELYRQTTDGQNRRVLKAIPRPTADGDALPPRKAMTASTTDGLGEYGVSGLGVVASIGSPLIPVIMVAFSDKDFLPENDETKISRFFNEEGYSDERYAVGSVADYYRHSSGGVFTPRFEVVAKVKLSHDYQYYGAHKNSQVDANRVGFVTEAVKLAEDQGVDFSRFSTDGRTPLVSIIHAGPGEHEDYGDDYQDYLWAHFSATSISANTTKFNSYLMSNETMRDFDDHGNVTEEVMTGIGTFCHEFGHALGLPDMYDVNQSVDGKGETPSYWDVMDYQFMYNGYRPMEFSAYERSMLGWMQREEIDASQVDEEFTLLPLNTPLAVEGNRVYVIVNPDNENEYFLLANRQSSPFMQASMLGHGMLVWHINYASSAWASNMVNTNAECQRVHVVPADGMWQGPADLNKRDEEGKRYTYTGDLFPGYTGRTTFDKTLENFFDGDFELRIVDIAEDADGVVTFRTAMKTDGVAGGTTLVHTDQLYDLSGRCVQGRNAHGVYVSEGRKIVK